MAPEVSIITPAKVREETGAGWLVEAIDSVLGQNFEDWEMVIIDDGSPLPLRPIQEEYNDPRLRWYHTEGVGTAAARNHAANLAEAKLLLPLDADDRLTPGVALDEFLAAWRGGGDRAGIVYSDIMIFGPNIQRYWKSAEYRFTDLLRGTLMCVGCLHRKQAWAKAGGWRNDLEMGLEDWEYWIKLGELGECGYHLPSALYWYRQNPDGRMERLRGDRRQYVKAAQHIRKVHQDVYNNIFPKGCCGTPGRGAPRSPQPARRSAPRPASAPRARQHTKSKRPQLIYIGPLTAHFSVRGRESGKQYRIPGRNIPFGVQPADIPHFMEMRQYQLLTHKPKQTQHPQPLPPKRLDEELSIPQSPLVAKEMLLAEPLRMHEDTGDPRIIHSDLLRDLRSLSVRNMQERLREVDVTTLLSALPILIIEEQQTRKRKTLVAWMERRLRGTQEKA